MDGVLCDFFSAASSHADRPIDELSVRQLWTLVRQVPDFWFNLEWLPGARELWKLLDEYDAHICLRSPTLTLVPNLVNLHGWKKHWIDRYCENSSYEQTQPQTKLCSCKWRAELSD